MTDLEKVVLDMAKIWLVDRAPSDVTEKALAAAIARAWPDELGSREDCTCGENETCEECPTRAEVTALVNRWESDAAALL